MFFARLFCECNLVRKVIHALDTDLFVGEKCAGEGGEREGLRLATAILRMNAAVGIIFF